MKKRFERITKLPLYKFFEEFIVEAGKNNISAYAGHATLFMLFSVVPFIMLLLTLLGIFLPIDINEMITWAYIYIPDELMDTFSSLIMEVFDKTGATGGWLSVSGLSLLWLASKAVFVLYLGINGIYCEDTQSNKNLNGQIGGLFNYFKQRILSMLYTVIFIFTIIFTIIAFGFGSSIEALLHEKLPIAIPVISTVMDVKNIVFPVLMTFLFALIYWFFEGNREKGSFKNKIFGAISATAGWLIFSWMYSIYIRYISNYSYVYGSLSAVVLLMLWLYICMNIFLYGALLNRMIKKHKADKNKP